MSAAGQNDFDHMDAIVNIAVNIAVILFPHAYKIESIETLEMMVDYITNWMSEQP